MKLLAETGGKKYEIDIVREGARVLANIDGRKYELEASEPETEVYLFKKDGMIIEAFVSSQTNLDEPTLVRVKNGVQEVRIIDPKRLRGSKNVDETASGRIEIKTAMPGKVVRILVSVGDTVQKGQGVIVIEAMKMQNEMKSPKDGAVSEIRGSEGLTVSAGDVLMVID